MPNENDMDVQFNEEQFASRQPVVRKETGLIGFLTSRGYAKDRKAAERILLGVAIVALIAAGFIFMSILGPSASSVSESVPPGS